MTNFDDLGRVTLTEDFPFSRIEEHLDGVPIKRIAREMAVDCTLEEQARIWLWVYQPPCKDLDGFLCRCIVACWVFARVLRQHSMTEVAHQFGKKKQSLGRWVDDFKRQFPALTKHLQHLKHR